MTRTSKLARAAVAAKAEAWLATVVSATCRVCSRASRAVLVWNSVAEPEPTPRVELLMPAVLVDWIVSELVES